jgi:hypothetical protein
VLQLAALLEEMWRLRDRPGAAQIPVASEASFTLRAYWQTVEGRLERMGRALADDPAVGAAHEFLRQDVHPLAGRVRAFVEERAPGLGLELDETLPVAERTLNPADHGFHNTLRRADGRLVFLDFEYAGWDDPAQMLANACLMPQVPLPGRYRPHFLRHMFARLGASRKTAARLRLIYPMLAFKWCLIMLNEFVPVAGVRRAFAGANDPDRRKNQFEKARAQLGVVEEALSTACFLDALPVISGPAAEDPRG